MKYTIEGFSQEYASTLKKTIIRNNKKVQIKIDCTDLVILRWFVDFYPNMNKMVVNGTEYATLTHKKVLEDLPLLDISKQSLIDRMKKMADFGILKYLCLKENGTYSLYTYGENYKHLVSGGVSSQLPTGVCSQLHTGVSSQLHTKDYSIKDYSIKDKKERKKATSYDEIISSLVDDKEIQDLLIEFVKMRKLIKKPMTDYALERLIKKLFNMSNSISEQKQILTNSITSSWQDIYPLKTETKTTNPTSNKLNEQYKAQNFNSKFLDSIVTDLDSVEI